MNKNEIQRNINDGLNNIRNGNRGHCGCFRFYKGPKRGNTWEHEFRKMQICWELKKRGIVFYTEAIFHNGKRADVIDLTNAIIYEVLMSEKLEECKKKVEQYPEFFEMRYVPADVEWETKLID